MTRSKFTGKRGRRKFKLTGYYVGRERQALTLGEILQCTCDQVGCLAEYHTGIHKYSMYHVGDGQLSLCDSRELLLDNPRIVFLKEIVSWLLRPHVSIIRSRLPAYYAKYGSFCPYGILECTGKQEESKQRKAGDPISFIENRSINHN